MPPPPSRRANDAWFFGEVGGITILAGSNAPGVIRTRDLRIRNPLPTESRNAAQSTSETVVTAYAPPAGTGQLDQKQDQRPRKNTLADPELRAVVVVWPSLPAPMRHGIVAMIRAFRSSDEAR